MKYVVSANNTIVTLGNGIISDANGNQWSVNATGQVVVNGAVDQTSSNVLKLAYENGRVYQMNTNRLWWSKAKPTDSWYPTYGTTVSPLVGVASPNNTVMYGSVTGLASVSSITDANGDKWTITASGKVSVNGITDGSTQHVIAIAYENGVVWQENSDKLWWSKLNAAAAWGPTYGTSTSPIPAGSSPSVTYFDGAVVNYDTVATPANYSVLTVADGDRAVTFNYTGVNTVLGDVKNVEGALRVNVNYRLGANQLTNFGTWTVQGGIGGASLDVKVSAEATFTNNGVIAVNASSYVKNSFIAELPSAKGQFINQQVIKVDGTGDTLTFNAGTMPSPDRYITQFVNNGVIQATNGGQILLNAPIAGTGTVSASSGSLIKVAGPVSETIQIDRSSLEFGPSGSLGTPAMQFAGTIVGEGAGSTILLDGVWGTAETFKVLSTAGAGLAELIVYAGPATVADLKMVGHYQAADFVLHPYTAAAGSWTNIDYVDHANTSGVLHS